MPSWMPASLSVHVVGNGRSARRPAGIGRISAAGAVASRPTTVSVRPAWIPTLASTLASKCADNLEPPIRPEIEIGSVDGQAVVVALVDELDAPQKPCLVEAKGAFGVTGAKGVDARVDFF